MTPIGTDEELIVRLRKYGHIEAADALQSRIAEADELKHDLERQMTIANAYVNECIRLTEALTDIRNRVLCPVGPSPTIDELQAIASATLSQHGKV